MHVVRPPYAIHPGLFGRGPSRVLSPAPRQRPALSISSDVRLFALTFLGGFLFVSVLIG